MNGTTVSNGISTGAAQQASDLNATLMRQLMGLLDATMRETWLPMGFRVLVVQDFPAMRRSIKRGRSGHDELRSFVTHLLEESDPYRTFSKRSVALRVLHGLRADLASIERAA